MHCVGMSCQRAKFIQLSYRLLKETVSAAESYQKQPWLPHPPDLLGLPLAETGHDLCSGPKERGGQRPLWRRARLKPTEKFPIFPQPQAGRQSPLRTRRDCSSGDSVLSTTGAAVLWHHESGLGGPSHPTPDPRTSCLTTQTLPSVFTVLASLVPAREAGVLVSPVNGGP